LCTLQRNGLDAGNVTTVVGLSRPRDHQGADAMAKTGWFLAGFLFALTLGGLLVLLPLRGADAATALDPHTPPAHADPAPVATPQPGLVWLRRAALDPLLGACSRLEIDAAWQIRYGPCDEGPRLAYLSQADLETYQAYMQMLAPFRYQAGDSVALTFAGRGERSASPQEQLALLTWAEGIYRRLMGEEQRANLLAQARLDLMARQGVELDAIRVVAMEPVQWPDACLGLRKEGVFCAQVSTPGYRVVLAAEGQTYPYRADAYGRVQAEAGHPPHLMRSPAAP
jgi:hypothetical protein